MQKPLSSLLLCFTLGNAACADILFSLTPVTQSIVQGDVALFTINVSSNSGPVTVIGLETRVAAGNGRTEGAILPTSPITILNTGYFLPGNPQVGTAFGAVNQVGGTLIDGPIQFGQIYLDTTGATLGTHSMVLDSELAVNGNNLPIPIAFPGASVQYTVEAAIPEPTSFLLLAMSSLCSTRIRNRYWHARFVCMTK